LSLARSLDGRGATADPVGVLLTDRGSAPGFRSGRRLRRLSKRDLDQVQVCPRLFIVCAASTLPEVADLAADANRRHRLRGLLIRQDVETGLIGPMLDRAGLRMWENVIVHQGPPLPERILRAWEMEAEDQLIAAASVAGGVLFALSCALERFEVPIRKIPALARMRPQDVQALETSPDGSHVHWPKGDIHLDLSSLRYVIDPAWRAKADSARVGHHRRFGEAVRAMRERHGLTQAAVDGLSTRHVRRIENGTLPKVSTLRLLARAHGMDLEHYLKAVAAAAEQLDAGSNGPRCRSRAPAAA